MEKRKLLFVFLMLVMGGLFFSSCSKDDITNSLNGTLWEGETFFEDEIILNIEINFNVEEGVFVLSVRSAYSNVNIATDTVTFTYNYNHPKANLVPRNNIIVGEMEATISGDEMILHGENLSKSFKLKRIK